MPFTMSDPMHIVLPVQFIADMPSSRTLVEFFPSCLPTRPFRDVVFRDMVYYLFAPPFSPVFSFSFSLSLSHSHLFFWDNNSLPPNSFYPIHSGEL